MDQLVLLSGPLVVGAVIGAWVSIGRLYVIRAGGLRLPAWIPWGIALLGSLAGLVLVASQLITLSTGLEGTGITTTAAAERASAAIIAMLLSPVWIGSASLAVLGMVLHYALDYVLDLAAISPTTREGLALGVRAAWVAIGLLTVLFGLQVTYSAAIGRFDNTVLGVVEEAGIYRLVMNVLALLLALLGMAAPLLVEVDSENG
jgi:hypothetical protein